MALLRLCLQQLRMKEAAETGGHRNLMPGRGSDPRAAEAGLRDARTMPATRPHIDRRNDRDARS